MLLIGVPSTPSPLGRERRDAIRAAWMRDEAVGREAVVCFVLSAQVRVRVRVRVRVGLGLGLGLGSGLGSGLGLANPNPNPNPNVCFVLSAQTEPPALGALQAERGISTLALHPTPHPTPHP